MFNDVIKMYNKYMKIIRIILLILIIIGVIALITQKIWVPKLVNQILLSENVSIIPSVQKNLSFENGRQCYTYTHEATKNEPTTVNEFMDITINNGKITGTKKGNQNGLEITNGYDGTLIGTLNNNMMDVLFSYTVEGSQGKQKEIYKVKEDKTGIEKLRYPLIEKNGILVPDTTKEFKTLFYARVGCVASN